MLERARNHILIARSPNHPSRPGFVYLSDFAKDLAIIWPDFDAKARTIKIFIGGLSNEIAVIDDPVETDENGQPERVFLRKTLELNYEIAGDPAFRSHADLAFKNQAWIMR